MPVTSPQHCTTESGVISARHVCVVNHCQVHIYITCTRKSLNFTLWILSANFILLSPCVQPAGRSFTNNFHRNNVWMAWNPFVQRAVHFFCNGKFLSGDFGFWQLALLVKSVMAASGVGYASASSSKKRISFLFSFILLEPRNSKKKNNTDKIKKITRHCENCVKIFKEVLCV